MKEVIKSLSNLHRSKGKDIAVLATPRGGSTWMMQIVASQKAFKAINEPFNIRDPLVRRSSGIFSWQELYEARTERIKEYLNGFQRGKFGGFNPNPFRRGYRPFSARLVFKIIHLRPDWLFGIDKLLNLKIIMLLRHPVPVALSRKEFPVLDFFENEAFSAAFSKEQIGEARNIAIRGSHLEKGVLAWCLHNAPVLWDPPTVWEMFFYEECVLNEEKEFERLLTFCECHNKGRALEQAQIPSLVIGKSDRETQAFLRKGQSTKIDRRFLVEKWRKRVTNDELRQVQGILDMFRVDKYKADEFSPQLGTKA